MPSELDIPRLFEIADVVTPMVIRAAVTLRLPEHVQEGVVSVSALAERTGSVPRVLAKVVDHLVALEIFRWTVDNSLELTNFGLPLLSNWEGGLFRSSLDVEDPMGKADMAITGLLHTIRTGETAYEGLYGKTFWADVNEDNFLKGRAAELAPIQPGFDAHLVIDSFDWSDRTHVVDVGGNNGALLAAVLHAHPHLHGTLFDLEEFAHGGDLTFRHRGVQERASVVTGSFFDSLPTHGDIYVLSAILADWSDDDAVRILKRCAEAAGPRGKVLLAEVHMTDHLALEPLLRTALEVRYEVDITCPDRSVDDLCELAARAGLDVERRGPSTSVRSLLELCPQATGAST